jgi:hypothetical protein
MLNNLFKSFLIGFSSPIFFLFGKCPFESKAIEQGEKALENFNKSLFFYKKN